MNIKLYFIFYSFFFSSLVFSQLPSDSLTVSPNPFVKRTLIRYYLSSADTTSLTVVNNLGATAITIYTNTLKASGSYQDSIIMDNFPNGIYYVLLKPSRRSPLTLKIVKTSATSVPKTVSFNNFNIYPNPVNDKLHIQLNGFEGGNLSLELFNSQAEIIKMQDCTGGQNEFDLTNLPKGIYFLSVRDSETQKVFTVIKN